VEALPPWLEPHADRRLGDLIDHTLLRPEASEAEILRLCDEAMELGLGAVCVNGQWMALASRHLAGSPVRTVGVVGFPLGASGRAAKAAETALLLRDGAAEIDVVQSLGWAKTGQWSLVRSELSAVVKAAQGCPVKVILETAALSASEIEPACDTARAAGAVFVKTSTGFHSAGGATTEAVAALRRTVGTAMGVKASGGIRTGTDAVAMLRAGADRIGTSSAAGWRELIGRHGPTVAALFG
jgi:deoxyribose-phosphate aldolase